MTGINIIYDFLAGSIEPLKSFWTHLFWAAGSVVFQTLLNAILGNIGGSGPKNIQELTPPETREGRPIPIVLGRALIESSVILDSGANLEIGSRSLEAIGDKNYFQTSFTIGICLGGDLEIGDNGATISPNNIKLEAMWLNDYKVFDFSNETDKYNSRDIDFALVSKNINADDDGTIPQFENITYQDINGPNGPLSWGEIANSNGLRKDIIDNSDNGVLLMMSYRSGYYNETKTLQPEYIRNTPERKIAYGDDLALTDEIASHLIYRGIAKLYVYGVIGTSLDAPPLKFEVSHYPNPLGISEDENIFIAKPGLSGLELNRVKEYDLNPASAIVYLLKSAWGGANLDITTITGTGDSALQLIVNGESEIDYLSFRNAAITLAQEQNGVSLSIDSQQDMSNVLKSILDQIEGFLYYTETGDIALNLIRQTQEELDSAKTILEQDIIKIDSIEKTMWKNVATKVSVNYPQRYTRSKQSMPSDQNRPDNESDFVPTYDTRTVVAADQSAIELHGFNELTVRFDYCRTRELASYLASRLLASLGKPTYKFTIKIRDTGRPFNTGDLIKVNFSDADMENLPARVMKVTYGDLEKGDIQLDCLEENFNSSPNAYDPEDDGTWVDPFTGKGPARPPVKTFLWQPTGHVMRFLADKRIEIAAEDQITGFIPFTVPANDQQTGQVTRINFPSSQASNASPILPEIRSDGINRRAPYDIRLQNISKNFFPSGVIATDLSGTAYVAGQNQRVLATTETVSIFGNDNNQFYMPNYPLTSGYQISSDTPSQITITDIKLSYTGIDRLEDLFEEGNNRNYSTGFNLLLVPIDENNAELIGYTGIIINPLLPNTVRLTGIARGLGSTLIADVPLSTNERDRRTCYFVTKDTLNSNLFVTLNIYQRNLLGRNEGPYPNSGKVVDADKNKIFVDFANIGPDSKISSFTPTSKRDKTRTIKKVRLKSGSEESRPDRSPLNDDWSLELRPPNTAAFVKTRRDTENHTLNYELIDPNNSTIPQIDQIRGIFIDYNEIINELDYEEGLLLYRDSVDKRHRDAYPYLVNDPYNLYRLTPTLYNNFLRRHRFLIEIHRGHHQYGTIDSTNLSSTRLPKDTTQADVDDISHWGDDSQFSMEFQLLPTDTNNESENVFANFIKLIATPSGSPNQLFNNDVSGDQTGDSILIRLGSSPTSGLRSQGLEFHFRIYGGFRYHRSLSPADFVVSSQEYRYLDFNLPPTTPSPP